MGGACGFFVHTNLANIAETCGINFKDADIVVLTSKTVQPNLQIALDAASKKYHFRHIKAPFDTNVHLELIDWAVRNSDLQDWISLQHMDTFWKPKCVPWLKITKSIIKENPNRIAITSKDTCQRVLFDGKFILGLSDFVGAYNRLQLIDKDLKFNWGSVKDLKISNRTRELIECRRFSTLEFEEIEWLDGSELITLELFANYPPDVIAQYNYNQNLIHPWSIVRPLISSTVKNKTLNMPFTKMDFNRNIQNWAIMSLISSCHFDVDYNDKFLPWNLFSEITGFSEEDVMQKDLFKIMSKYENPKNIFGKHNMKIKHVKFYGDTDVDTDATNKKTFI